MREFYQAATASGMLDLNEALIDAAGDGKAETIRALLDGGADVHAGNEWAEKDAALCAASLEGNLEIVKILLAAGADVNADSGRPLLRAADNMRHVDSDDIDWCDLPRAERKRVRKLRDSWSAATVKVLLKAGADVHHASEYGQGRDKALLRAAWCGHTKTVKVLLDAGADQHWLAGEEATRAPHRNEFEKEIMKLLRKDALKKGIIPYPERYR